MFIPIPRNDDADFSSVPPEDYVKVLLIAIGAGLFFYCFMSYL
jgi:hypothetical protein